MVIKNKLFACTALCSLLFSSSAFAEMIEHNTAQLQAMDKITGRVSVIEVPVNGEIAFGSFSIVVRACKATPPEETPENYAFVDVADSSFGKMQFNIFKGWMMSSSPALNAVEHPIYDVWLLKCKDTAVDSAKLLTAEQLKERDTLPKLADIKQDKEQTALPVPAENKPEAVPDSAEDNKDRVLENYTAPASAQNETVSEPVVPLAEAETNAVVETGTSVSEPVTDSGPQPLLNIPAPLGAEAEPIALLPDEKTVEPQINVDETNIIESNDWVELPSASSNVTAPAPEAAEVSQPIAEKVSIEETPVTVPAAAALEPLVPAAASESLEVPAENNIESLPEDEEDQFIDLSSEADATAALEAELSAEALKD